MVTGKHITIVYYNKLLFYLLIFLIYKNRVNIYFGIGQYQSYADSYDGSKFGIWQIIYLIWIGLVCVVFIVGEYWYNYRNGVFFWNTSDPESSQNRIQSLINDFHKLPDVTWDVCYKQLGFLLLARVDLIN